MSEEKARELDIDFGDLVEIEQHRYGSDNEKYIYKVIGRLQSNTWVDVPVVSAETETIHLHQMEEVVRCICCGVDETKVSRFRVSDVNILEHTKDEKKLQKENEALKEKLEKSKEILKRIAGKHEKYQCDDFDDCQMTAEEHLEDLEAENEKD
ncbi:MAG: hypothetical protein GOVbin1174_48 [Prokaryotic dsDNA virus sp.]|jgi:hypothetical protein|nr:MAG: hypothetical protein GOVbin1174_48 [Prokaryotic dsDNA virus sp.]|tara:strand:+ start:4954 stop:5412 length:459 start_codon:yes stop_codon:yes gene_type:complete